MAESDTAPNVRSLRTNSLKECRELREAAIFCHGMGERLGRKVFLAQSESQDYDFVGYSVVGDLGHFTPVQLKEVVPADLNPAASVQKTIDALAKYADSEDLTVAIHLSQRIHFDPSSLIIPNLRIGGLWVFGAISADQSEWALWGDLLSEVKGEAFEYPS